ncbi:hypothetical protein PTKIN_Ptkin10aG0037500 [Pterospermum kingtungense]
MDEIGETALAYYEKLPQSQKQKAQDFFGSLDKNGDGKVDLQEYIAELNQRGIRGITNISFFKELDKDGSGSLDFNKHHDPAVFVDNYVLLRSIRLQQGSQSEPSPSQESSPKTQAAENQVFDGLRRDCYVVVWSAIGSYW